MDLQAGANIKSFLLIAKINFIKIAFVNLQFLKAHMNLIIDAGNTQLKWAVFRDGKLIKKNAVEYASFPSALTHVFKEFEAIDRIILSSVGHFSSEFVEALKVYAPLHILTHNSKLPFKNLYKTPKTLGVDRMALVSASVKNYPQKNCLIIDAGTCITYDFIDSHNNYLGGSISPGIRLRYKALHNLTAKLPLLETKQPKGIIGNTTDEAIHSGVVYGIYNEIDGVIDNYKLNYPDLTVILTGGDAKFLSKKLKSTIFANPNFLLEGLNFILKHNSY